jgi:glycosyltransferase involved in cell wall biosynthesis
MEGVDGPISRQEAGSFYQAGDGALTPSLTIVLPVHNGESRLRSCVGEILELASELTPDFAVLIVDDGSTDDTLAAAEELSACYPQISVRRQRERRGLQRTLQELRRSVRSDVVIVHDGVSAIDPNQVRTLWRAHVARKMPARPAQLPGNAAGLADIGQTHAAMARAHSRLLGFQLLGPQAEAADASLPILPQRADAAQVKPQPGVGQIPPLPRPKFLSALADFALGE